jgi:hypothetical protein
MSTRDRVAEFIGKLADHSKRLGGGKVGLDSLYVRRLVAEDPEAAAAAVFAYSEQGKQNPVFFQMAMAIAAAYQVEFADDSLTQSVQQAIEKHGPPPPIHTAPREANQAVRSKNERALRQLGIAEQDLKKGNVADFVRLFSVETATPDQLEIRRQICGSCVLVFPSTDSDPRPVTLIPEVRRFITNLHDRMPYFPVYLNFHPKLGTFFLYFGCLADRAALSKDGTEIKVTHDTVGIRVFESLTAIAGIAGRLGIDHKPVARSIVAPYPPELANLMLARL